MYGVINTRDDRTRSFMAEFKPSFRILRDEDMSIVHALGVMNSPTVVQISTHGKIMNVWRGFGADKLKDINKAVAKANRKPVASIDFSKAPATTQFGVNYSPLSSRG